MDDGERTIKYGRTKRTVYLIWHIHTRYRKDIVE